MLRMRTNECAVDTRAIFIKIVPTLCLLLMPFVSLADTTFTLDPMLWQYLRTDPSICGPSCPPQYQYNVYAYGQSNPAVDAYFSLGVQAPYPPSFSPSGITIFLPKQSGVGTLNVSYFGFGGSESITISASTTFGLECATLVSTDNNAVPTAFIPIPTVPYTFTFPVNTALYDMVACRNTGGTDIYLDIASITYTSATLDLQVATPIVAQAGATTDSQGNLVVQPGIPVSITVPVTGKNFMYPEARSTTVTLQAGSQTLSQTVNLVDIPSSGNLMVPLSVTFGTQDAGPQVITATVDPGNALNESDFTNNSASTNVNVGGKSYKLIAYVNGTQVPDGGSSFDANPSDFIFNENVSVFALGGAWSSQPQNIQLKCVDSNTYPPTPVTGCQFQIQPLALGNADTYSSGGHTHTDNRPFILSGTEALFAYDGAIHSVDVYGQNLTFWPPIIAGDVVANISGFDSQGNPITAVPPITFRVKVPGLEQLKADNYDLKCELQPNDPGCPGGGYQHENFYNVTPDVNQLISKIVGDYDKAVPSDPNNFVVTDASLLWGGLYDLGTRYGYTYWDPPHKYHRQGTDIDVRRTMIDEDMFELWVCKDGGYPLAEDSTHYHLFFYLYANSNIAGLCSTDEVGQ